MLSAGSAFATSGRTIASAPPTGQNGNLLGVSAVSDSDAWAVGDNSSLAGGELEHWNGTSWARVTYPLPTSTGFRTP